MTLKRSWVLITVAGVDYDASTRHHAVGVLAVGDTVTIVYVVEEDVNVALSVIEDEDDCR